MNPKQPKADSIQESKLKWKRRRKKKKRIRLMMRRKRKKKRKRKRIDSLVLRWLRVMSVVRVATEDRD